MARTKRLNAEDDGTPLTAQSPSSAAAAAAPVASSAAESGSDSDPKKQGKGDRADRTGKKLHVGDALQYLDKVKEAFLEGRPSDPEQNYVKFLDIMKVGEMSAQSAPTGGRQRYSLCNAVLAM
jgi:histone deacetylase complex regulatory component SIN3